MINKNTDISLFEESVFNIDSITDFNAKALHLFHFQYQNNTLYRHFCELLKTDPSQIHQWTDIPCLPIRFFKSEKIITNGSPVKNPIQFTSSGTTGSQTSIHFVENVSIYERSFIKGVERIYGNPADYVFLALLPSYLERKGSSLVYMTEYLIKLSKHSESGFYLNDHDALFQKLKYLEEKKQKTILIGVSFALLDFSEKYSLQLNNTIVMETGGMKGRRDEITRAELHTQLKKAFQTEKIHSEYGMTELLSQAYSVGDGIFQAPPWMNIKITSLNDPLQKLTENKTGKINVIDLANIYSCAFIATDDIGFYHPDGNFEITGRSDNSDIRGCSLLITS